MAYDFNGSTDRITFTPTTEQSTDITQITIAAWLYPDSVNQFKRFYELGTTAGGNTRSRVEFDGGWGWVFVAPFTTTEGKWSIATPSTGAWIHYCVTYDFGATTNDPVIYTNGASQSFTERVTPVGTGGFPSSSLGVLGSTISDAQHWDGRIAEFAIWNRILTAGEAAALGKGYSPAFFRNGLVMYVPLLRNAVELARGTTLTLDGTAAIAHPRIIYPSSIDMRRFTTAGGVPATSVKDIIGSGFIPFAR